MRLSMRLYWSVPLDSFSHSTKSRRSSFSSSANSCRWNFFCAARNDRNLRIYTVPIVTLFYRPQRAMSSILLQQIGGTSLGGPEIGTEHHECGSYFESFAMDN